MNTDDENEITFGEIYKVNRISDGDSMSENLLDNNKSAKNCCSYLFRYICFLYN